MKQWFFFIIVLWLLVWYEVLFIYLFFSITWVLLGRRVIGRADMVTALIELRSAGMVVNNYSRCTDVLMVTCYSVCFVVAVRVSLVSDKIRQWNIVKCLVKLEILSSDICSVLEGVCEKESWHKTGFYVVKWFWGAKQDVTCDRWVSHPASRTSLNVKNVTKVVKNDFWFYCSEGGITEGNTGSARLWQNT